MSHDSNSAEHTKAMIQQLNLVPNSMVVIYIPKDMTSMEKANFAETLFPLVKSHDINVLVLEQGMSVMELDDEQMNQLGWIRDPKTVSTTTKLN